MKIFKPPKKYQKKDMCFVDFTYNRENDNNYRNNMVTALEVFDSIQENIKKIKEGKINNKCLSAHVKNSGSNNSIRSNKSIENEKTNSNNFGKNSFIVNENINVNSFENCKSYSKGKKLNDDKKNNIKINNNNTIQTGKKNPVNVFSNKSHYIPVSNNKGQVNNSIKPGSKGKSIKKNIVNDNNNNSVNKKIISHPTSAIPGKKINNIQHNNIKENGPMQKKIVKNGPVKMGPKINKNVTASVLNKTKPVSAKLKK